MKAKPKPQRQGDFRVAMPKAAKEAKCIVQGCTRKPASAHVEYCADCGADYARSLQLGAE